MEIHESHENLDVRPLAIVPNAKECRACRACECHTPARLEQPCKENS